MQHPPDILTVNGVLMTTTAFSERFDSKPPGTACCLGVGAREDLTNVQFSILNSHPKGEAAACVRAVLSARMSTSNSGEIKELLAMMRIQTAVSLSSFCTIRIL